MKKCYVITSHIEGDPKKIIAPSAHDLIICADGGYEIAVSIGITPDFIIGDSDSGEMQPAYGSKTKVIRFPTDKDESDTYLCVKHAVDLGFKDIVIAGGIGGRLDHTISNIQTLAHFSNKANIALVDENEFVTVVENSSVTLQKRDGFFVSLFSLSDKSIGVTTKGLAYPLDNAELNNSYPVGLSNEFIAPEAIVEVKSGKLLIIMSAAKRIE